MIVSGAFYVSEATRPMDYEELEELQTRAAIANAQIGVTGILVRLRNRFFQFIEGPARSTDILLGRIAADDRHEILRSSTGWRLEERQFPHWSMQLLESGDVLAMGVESTLFGPMLQWKSPADDDHLDAVVAEHWTAIARTTVRSFSKLEHARRQLR